MGIKEKSENFNSLRPILFELCKKNYRGGGQIAPPPPAGIGLKKSKQYNVLNIGRLIDVMGGLDL